MNATLLYTQIVNIYYYRKVMVMITKTTKTRWTTTTTIKNRYILFIHRKKMYNFVVQKKPCDCW